MMRIQPMARANSVASATAPVLTTARLKPGFGRDDLSRYQDDHWDLGPAVFQESARRCHTTVNFDTIEDIAIREALRAYLYVRLNIRLRGGPPILPPAGVRQAFNKMRRFFEFVAADQGAFSLASVDQPMLDRYVRHLTSSKSRGPAYNAQLLGAVRELYEFRELLSGAGLAFEPFKGRPIGSIVGFKSRRNENGTPRIPEDIVSALLRWSLKYVSLYSGDIFAARTELDHLHERRLQLMDADAQRPHSTVLRLRRQRVVRFLKKRVKQGRGAPVWANPRNDVRRIDPATGNKIPTINWHLICLHAGVDGKRPQHFGLSSSVKTVVEQHLLSHSFELGGLDTPITIDPDASMPWRPRFDAHGVEEEERMLQTACYILCAYLTGMRDCEVQAMKRGCLSVSRSEDGLIERYRVRSNGYKFKTAGGEPADWITIEPVANAVRVLERLAARIDRHDAPDTLWPVLSQRATCKPHVSAEIVRNLNAFVAHINNDLCSDGDNRAVPQSPDGAPWRLTTRQFRRTIAWHIANRPFGTVAGMIQYKHASVAAFEGYAGSSRSGFRRQVVQERRLGQLDDILAYFDERRLGEHFGGPAAQRINAALDKAADDLAPLPGKIADRRRLRTMLASLAKTLHVGVLADCFFDPSTALCLKAATTPAGDAPHTALCQPTKCPNACIRVRHLPAWKRASDDARRHLKQKHLSAVQRSVLKSEVERINAVIDSIAKVD